MPETITIHPLVFVVAGAIPLVAFVRYIVVGGIFRIAARISRSLRIQAEEREIRAAEREEREAYHAGKEALYKAELVDLLPEPWLAAYKECEKANDHYVRQAWLVARIAAWRRQDVSIAMLPRLSMNALSAFAKMVSANRGGDDYRVALEALGPFFDMPESPNEVMTANKGLLCPRDLLQHMLEEESEFLDSLE